MLNPIGLHNQLFDASVHAARRRPAAIVVEELPVIGLTCRVAHALNDATKSASIDAMRMVFITTVYGPM
jgi:hypothetical protein